MVLKVTTTNQRGEKVLEGGAEVAQPTTVYAFTGQGSQEPGMGMELYASSPVAKEVWDRADKHFMDNYGNYTEQCINKHMLISFRICDYQHCQEQS